MLELTEEDPLARPPAPGGGYKVYRITTIYITLKEILKS